MSETRPGTVTGDAARITRVDEVAARTVDLTIASPALGRDGHARILLPARPAADAPVLLLLHGCCDMIPGWTAWTANTDVAELTAGTGVMVVMPEAGTHGMYSDWWNGGAGGPPAWETFHLRELLPLLEREFGAGGRRAVAGLSMGGLGTLGYAARHRDLFRSAASFSGVLHTVPGAGMLMEMVAAFGGDPLALWGDPVEQAAIWRAHSPYELAPRLRGLPLYIASGNGTPGPLDPPGAADDALEAVLDRANRAFVERAGELGLTVTANLYGPGTHTWPYWERELHRAFPMLMRSIGAA
ncbi:alpha/beta hydrolase family protein [Spirillospora sp. NPDC029432]|uniref:alpha/beta hydrolase n=1 Tax=Spirillospora sp. NPDC029432 TaxID=3154599 RepID=UPI003452A192